MITSRQAQLLFLIIVTFIPHQVKAGDMQQAIAASGNGSNGKSPSVELPLEIQNNIITFLSKVELPLEIQNNIIRSLSKEDDPFEGLKAIQFFLLLNTQTAKVCQKVITEKIDGLCKKGYTHKECALRLHMPHYITRHEKIARYIQSNETKKLKKFINQCHKEKRTINTNYSWRTAFSYEYKTVRETIACLADFNLEQQETDLSLEKIQQARIGLKKQNRPSGASFLEGELYSELSSISSQRLNNFDLIKRNIEKLLALGIDLNLERNVVYSENKKRISFPLHQLVALFRAQPTYKKYFIEKFLSYGASPSQLDHKGNNVLHIIARFSACHLHEQGYFPSELINPILEKERQQKIKNPLINGINKDKKTPLHIAIQSIKDYYTVPGKRVGWLVINAFLHDEKVDLTITDDAGNSLLHVLLKAIFRADNEKEKEECMQLLANKDLGDMWHQKNNHGNTPLAHAFCWASVTDDIVLKILLDKKLVDVNDEVFNECSPYMNERGTNSYILHEVVDRGSEKVVNLLIESGADISLTDAKGRKAGEFPLAKGYSNATKISLGMTVPTTSSNSANNILPLTSQDVKPPEHREAVKKKDPLGVPDSRSSGQPLESHESYNTDSHKSSSFFRVCLNFFSWLYPKSEGSAIPQESSEEPQSELRNSSDETTCSTFIESAPIHHLTHVLTRMYTWVWGNQQSCDSSVSPVVWFKPWTWW